MKRLIAVVLPALILVLFSADTLAITYCSGGYKVYGNSCTGGDTAITKKKYEKLWPNKTSNSRQVWCATKLWSGRFSEGICKGSGGRAFASKQEADAEHKRLKGSPLGFLTPISTGNLIRPIFFAVFLLLNIHWWVFVILHVWFLRKESKDMPFLGRVAIVSFITVCAAYLFERYVIKQEYFWVPSILAIAFMAVTVNGIWDAIRKHRSNPNESGAIKSVAHRIKPVLNPTDSELSENDRKLRHLKSLLDDGVITEEDYAMKKKELLDKF